MMASGPSAGAEAVETDGRPVWVGELDIATFEVGSRSDGEDVLRGPDGQPYAAGRVLVRFQGEPLGMLTVDLDGGSLDRAAVSAKAKALYADKAVHLAGPSWASEASLPSLSRELRSLSSAEQPAVSVVIGTRNRPELIVSCVELVLAQWTTVQPVPPPPMR